MVYSIVLSLFSVGSSDLLYSQDYTFVVVYGYCSKVEMRVHVSSCHATADRAESK